MISPQALRAAMPWDKIQKGLCAWANQTTGLVTIWGEAPGDTLQPQRPYASVEIVDGPFTVGRDGVTVQDNTTNVPTPTPDRSISQVVFGMRRISVQAKFFSGGNDPTTNLPVAQSLQDTALSYAGAFHTSASFDAVMTLLRSYGLTVSNLGKVTPLPYPEEAVWVSSAAVDFDCYFGFIATGVDFGGYVNEVIGTGTETDSSASIPFDVKGPG